MRLSSILFFSLFLTQTFPLFVFAQEEKVAPAFAKVLERVRQEYVEEVTDQKLFEGAVDGMLTNLDPHSSYLDQETFRNIRQQTMGQFGGLGLEIIPDSGLIRVVSALDDTPAFKAGLRENDYITHIDHEAVFNMPMNAALNKMRGTPGSSVVLKIGRENQELFEVTLKREIININPVKFRIEDNIAYIRIALFNEKTLDELTKAVHKINETLGKNLLGFVIDVRSNPGGLFDQAIAVCDAFLDSGEIVSTRGKDIKKNRHFHATPGDITKGRPIVIMINGGSASGSEILAGAIQDNKRGIVIGTKSFGKGSVQTVIPISSKTAIKLTTAHYFTPQGRSIQRTGIEPDILVPIAKIEEISEEDRTRESNYHGALKNQQQPIFKKSNSNKDNTKDKNDKNTKFPDMKVFEIEKVKNINKKSPGDYQLQRAYDLIKGYYVFKDHVK